MAGSSKHVVSARQALERARSDLEKKLAAEPAWAALAQLEARIERGEPSPGIDYEELRSRLVQRLDVSVPSWRTLTAIEAAISALDTAAGQNPETRAGPPPLPLLGRATVPPPPLPVERQAPQPAQTGEVPAREAPARTRYGAAATNPPRSPQDETAAPPRPPRRAPPPTLPREQRLQNEPERAEPRRTPSAGHRIASALGLVGDGPARLTAIEAEIERMMRRDVGTWNNEDVVGPSVPPPSAASPIARARDIQDRRPYPTPASPEPGMHGEEAEVEIVSLGPSRARSDPRPISRLADRLRRADPLPEEETIEPIPMIDAIEEAEVEIVLLDQPTPARPGGHMKDGPPTGKK